METIDVVINVQGHFCNDWPCVEVSGNNHIYFNGIVQELQEIRFQLPACSTNLIVIKHMNKRFGEHGVWDVKADGDVITQDRAVKLLDVELNTVSVRNWVFDQCRFTTEHGERLQTDYFGHNGSISIEFDCPVYEWIICNCVKPTANPESSNFVINTTSDNLFDYTKDIEELDEIERILDQHAHLFNKLTKV
jgi:hypothetical protein